MKKAIMCLLMAMGGVLIAFADNSLSLSATNGAPGSTVKVTVSLSHTDDIVGGEIHIPLGEQMEYVEDSFSKNSSHFDGHDVTTSITDNTLNVFFISTELKSLVKSQTELFSFDVKLGNEPRTYTLTPTAILSGASGTALTTSVSSTSVKILAPKLEFGSSTVNFGSVAIRSSYTRTLTVKNTGTTQLNVTGVECSAQTLKVSSSSFSLAAGGSKSLTVTYSPTVRGAISETLSFRSNASNGTQKATVTASPYSVNTLSVVGSSGISGTTAEVKLNMSNMEPIVGVQCSFTLPTGIEYVDGSFASSTRSSSLSSSASVVNGVLTLYLYSIDNIAIEEGSGCIGTFKVSLNNKSGSYTLTPTDVVLSNAAMENMMSSKSSGTVTIQSPTISCNSSLDMSSTSVTETASKLFTIKNSGKVAMTVSRVNFLAEGYSVNETLPITIAAGANKSITVNYKGSVAGSYSTTMNIYTDDPVTPMKTVAVSGTLFEPNYISVNSILSTDQKTCSVNVSLDNYSEIVAVQMNVHGLTDMTVSSSDLVLTDRCLGLSPSVSKIGDGEYQIILYSFGNTPIKGNTGKLFTLKFTSTEVKNSNDLNITIDNILLSNSKSKNIASSSTTSSSTFLLGDANGDGIVSVSDFTAVASAILGSEPTNYEKSAADVNMDGIVSVSDLTGIANIILYNQISK